MADQWYYAHEGSRVGPFSGRQLRGLAVAGQLLRTDTVWKEGVEQGVAALRVKHLFVPAGPEAPPPGPPTAPALPASPPATGVSPPPEEVPAPPQGAASPEAAVPEEAEVPGDPVRPTSLAQAPSRPGAKAAGDAARASVPPPARKLTAVGLRGAVVVGQDGTHAQYKKKCLTCGHEDPARTRILIKKGTVRVGFFCPKCRKRREAEIQGREN